MWCWRGGVGIELIVGKVLGLQTILSPPTDVRVQGGQPHLSVGGLLVRYMSWGILGLPPWREGGLLFIRGVSVVNLGGGPMTKEPVLLRTSDSTLLAKYKGMFTWAVGIVLIISGL